MPRFNADKIAKLISEMRNAFERLRLLSSVAKDKFLGNNDKIDSTKYNFIIAIDISNHIISQNNYRLPKDFGDTFQVLFEQGVFDEKFLKNLKAMTKFRNRLVHIYWEVNNEQIYDYLQINLKDFTTFVNKISEFLQLNNI
jgi:uncharacterized protein YutE (UPF0331/DUF86 family)